jgi:hypothetical protein
LTRYSCLMLGVLVFLLLLLAIVTCRVTGLPVAGDRHLVPRMQPGTGWNERPGPPALELNRVLQMVNAGRVTRGARSY